MQKQEPDSSNKLDRNHRSSSGLQPQARCLPLGLSQDQITQHNDSLRSISRPAVFLDRDGTINAERGYLRVPEEVALLPTVCKALSLLNSLNIPTIVITNQSALGRGLMNWDEFDSVSATLWRALQQCDVHYDALYYCPHAPDSTSPCACRKPRPGLFLKAAVDFNLDLASSYMIGDKQSDLDAGYAAGCHTVLVRTGFGEKTYKALTPQAQQPDYIASTLLGAVQWIVRAMTR
jgi:D-glycero-D-manno-heptose 1,7-bisphosphate phosphatase